MIVGIGMDVCSVARFEGMVERHPGVVDRLLNPGERRVPIASQAARFAAKEALAKALGAPSGMSWHDSEVVRHDGGQPQFELRGTVAARAAELGITRVHLSISHDAGLACAYVVCEAL
ncbi:MULTISPECIES: holo-ACP synthase [Aestuariimicrobium]|uniref:holo-ACP synthase n=1 Tax=Aestuariimicrobium TaxID=396388 RepID=UPI000426A736|nr:MULTISPECIES: holo-ACP synthase [Aestuariimicrobium]CAI9406930.1 Holo-[acyl-carrier-protein] synthase [Aestuariimicrobium sp. T2.26MG-19.2B]